MKNSKLLNLVVVFTMLFLTSCSKDDPKPAVKSIVVATNKTTFTPGEAMTLTVKTDTGKDVTSDSKILVDGKEATSPYKAPATEGTFKIKATYKKLTSDEITLKAEKEVSSIAITTDKTTYAPKEAMTINVKTDTEKDITDDSKIFIDGTAATKPYKAPATGGDFKVKATYKTFSKEISITVVQTTAIPDPKFEEALRALGYDGTGDTNDGKVLTSKINTLTNLDVDEKGISNLTGIGGFTDLTTLTCSNNQLTSLNLSKNTKLVNLAAGYNRLTRVDLRNGNNENAESLDFTRNPHLTCIFVDNKAYVNEHWNTVVFKRADDPNYKYVEKEADCR